MAPRLITVLLGLTLVVCGFFAFEWRGRWHAAQDEVEALKSERDLLRRRVAEVEKTAKSTPRPTVNENAEGEDRESRRGLRTGGPFENPGVPFGGWRGGGARFFAMMDKPEIQRLMGIQQKAALDARFASLFRSLNLGSEDLEKFKNLLVEKQTAAMDALSAARAQGLIGPANRDAVHQAIASAQAEVDNTIRTTLGDAAFAQYQTYEQTLPERNVVSQLQQRLSYSSAPLTDAQSDQIIALLAANAPQSAQGPNSLPSNAVFFAAANPGLGPMPFRAGVQISDAVVAGSQGILNDPQIAALKQLQQEQQAQAQLADQMSLGRQASPSVTNAGAGPTVAPVHP